ncbi:hypothetical protein ScPMuIL_014594 [Solemya velum]
MAAICTDQHSTKGCSSNVQLACDGVYLAMPHTNTTIHVWKLQKEKLVTSKPLKLEGHRRNLTALCLGHMPEPKLLCSVGEDYAIVWNLDSIRQCVEQGEQVRGLIVGKNLGVVNYCAFNPDDRFVSVCRGLQVIVLEVKSQRPIATLEGHTGPVTCAEFCPHYSATLVTLSEDRSFKIWDINDGSLVYESPILSAFPLISLAMNLNQPEFAMGTSDGLIKIFDLTDGNNFRCLHSIDMSRIMSKMRDKEKEYGEELVKSDVIYSQPHFLRDGGLNGKNIDSPSEGVEIGVSVLALNYCYLPKKPKEDGGEAMGQGFLTSQNSVVEDLMSKTTVLVIGTTGAMVQLNPHSLEVLKYSNLQDPFSCVAPGSSAVSVSPASSMYFGQGRDYSNIWCVILSSFGNTIHILQWKLSVDAAVGHHCDVLRAEENHSPGLTVVSNVPLNEKSPLRSELVIRSKEGSAKSSIKTRTGKQGNRGTSVDKPVTFHTKVKSSGYTVAPRTQMFKPKLNHGKTSSSEKTIKLSTLKEALDRHYPADSPAPSLLKARLEVAEKPTPIKCIKFSDDGKYLACGLGNRSVSVLKMPFSDNGTSFVGHDHVVNTVDWSRDGSYLLTSSDDKTAAVWARGHSEAIMTFSTVDHSITGDERKSKTFKTIGCFNKEIISARFYYMDKFIFLTSGHELFLYKYYLDTSKEDIKRYINSCKYKLVQTFSVDSQRITAFSAINSFYSYIVICADSKKCLQVFDMNKGQLVHTIPDVHSRPIHTISQNEGSTFISQPLPAYDLFATAAAGDSIKLWDLRTNRCVRRFEGHLNKTQPCGLDLSPCGHYLATGAEDKAAYIFDLRMGTYCEKLTKHTDVVLDVAFHPSYPQLFTGSADGKLQVFSNS